MYVAERRRDLEMMLRTELPGTYVVVSAPDHPLLVEGPDVLVGGDGGLIAVYTPKASERARVERLAVRFILCRLALPSHTRHLLVLEDQHEQRMGERFHADFAEVFRWGGRRGLVKIAKDKDFFGQQRKLPDEISRVVQERFSDAFQTTRVLWRAARRDEEEPPSGYRDVRRRKGPRAQRSDFEQVAPGVIFTVYERGTPDTRAVYGLIKETTSSGFVLDSGVPHPMDANDYGLAFVDELPEYRGDPEKLVRAAAFAGWAFASGEQLNSLHRIADRLSERRKMGRSQ